MSKPLAQVDWEQLARDAKFRPADMAALCSISLRQLERFFAHHRQQTVRAWARTLRCRAARDLISQGWSNAAVAHELGFGNESHLCHEFKEFYAASPQTFAPTYRQPVKCRASTILSRLDNK
jgi:transcriptional regulator GlxA family with amidase domain